jgi:hypothetical protein
MNYSESVISSSRAAHDASLTGLSAQTTLFIKAQKAILTACALGLFTCNTDITVVTSEDLQALLETLHLSGFTTQISGITLNIFWTN